VSDPSTKPDGSIEELLVLDTQGGEDAVVGIDGLKGGDQFARADSKLVREPCDPLVTSAALPGVEQEPAVLAVLAALAEGVSLRDIEDRALDQAPSPSAAEEIVVLCRALDHGLEGPASEEVRALVEIHRKSASPDGRTRGLLTLLSHGAIRKPLTSFEPEPGAGNYMRAAALWSFVLPGVASALTPAYGVYGVWGEYMRLLQSMANRQMGLLLTGIFLVNAFVLYFHHFSPIRALRRLLSWSLRGGLGDRVVTTDRLAFSLARARAGFKVSPTNLLTDSPADTAAALTPYIEARDEIDRHAALTRLLEVEYFHSLRRAEDERHRWLHRVDVADSLVMSLGIMGVLMPILFILTTF